MNRTETYSQKRILDGTRIGLFGKGGSGKSTAVVLLATVLRDHGYEVCVVDSDSTNIGLSRALGIEQPPLPLIDYFGGMVFSGGRVTCPVDDPTPLADSELFLEDLPSQYYRQNQAGITFLVVGKIGDMGPGAGCDGPVSKIARDLKIRYRKQAPVTLLDFKAGFEDTARGVITNLDWAIVLVDPTIAAIEMATSMRDMIGQIKNGRLPATQHLENMDLVAMANKIFTEARIKGVLVLMNKVKNSQMEKYLRTKLAERGIEPSGVIYEEALISNAWLMGTPLVLKKSQTDILDFIKELESAESQHAISFDFPTIKG
jgi:CO dehydrogenase nickel-insertion accessory protein CooC1